MKKLIVLLMVLAASGIYGAEYVPVTVSYGDGSDILRPDTAHAIVYLHKDTYIDSLVFDTTADWVTTAGGFLLDSVLSSSYTGEWYTIRYYVVKNNDAVVWEEEWHAKYLVDTASIARSAWDNDVIAQASRIANANAIQISGDATAADNFETMLDGTGGNEFTLKRLRLTTTTADDTALIIKSTAGTGASIYGDDDAFALYATSGDGLKITATTNGINAWGVTGSDILGDVNGTIVPTDTTATGQPVNLMPATATAADTAAYQGSASGLTVADIIDSILKMSIADTVNGSLWGQVLYQLDSTWKKAQADSAQIARSVWDNDVVALANRDINSVDTVLSSISTTADLSGEGTYPVTIRAVDSSGTDAAISGIPIAIWDMSSVLQGYLVTNSSGYVVFNQDSGSFVIGASLKNGYWWGYDTVLVAGAAETDTLWGYDIPVGSPGSANLCRLYGYMYGIDGQPVNGGVITASLPGRNMIDSCVGGALDGYEKSATTDSVGYWYLDLVKTLCVQSTIGSTAVNKYKVVGRFPSGTTAFEKTYEVPDSTSHKMTW